MSTIIIGAIIVGLILGLLGSGGSAITVPILVYLVGHDAKISIAESMAIVGAISAAGAIPFARKNNVDWRSVFLFGIPAMLGTYLGAWLGGLSSDAVQLVVFGVVLLLSAGMMIKKAFGKQEKRESDEIADSQLSSSHIGLIILEGTVVGALTGFVGVGGGFLIVPALLILGKLPMRMAIGTSLVIIVMKSLVGFFKYQHYLAVHDLTVDWPTIGIFVGVGLGGCAIGQKINERLNQRGLKQAFAVFLVLIGGFVVVREGSEMLTAKTPPSNQSASALDPKPGQQPIELFGSLSGNHANQNEIALQARDEMFDQLFAALKSSVKKFGVAESINVCQSKAPEIARRVGEDFDVKMGRTSFKLRNPQNKPPAWAAKFVKNRSTKEVNVALSGGRLGVLLPIGLGSSCLSCHGERELLTEEVKVALVKNYPGDLATGFRQGDLRGYFWIEVPKQ